MTSFETWNDDGSAPPSCTPELAFGDPADPADHDHMIEDRPTERQQDPADLETVLERIASQIVATGQHHAEALEDARERADRLSTRAEELGQHAPNEPCEAVSQLQGEMSSLVDQIENAGRRLEQTDRTAAVAPTAPGQPAPEEAIATDSDWDPQVADALAEAYGNSADFGGDSADFGPKTTLPACHAADPDWLNERFGEIAERIATILETDTTDYVLAKLKPRFDTLEERLEDALVTCANEEGIAAVLVALKELQSQIAGTEAHIERIEAIEDHVVLLIGSLTGSREDLSWVAKDATGQAIASMPVLEGMESSAISKNLAAMETLLSSLSDEYRGGEEAVTGTLENIQSTLQHLVTRVDAIEDGIGAVQKAARAPIAATVAPREAAEPQGMVGFGKPEWFDAGADVFRSVSQEARRAEGPTGTRENSARRAEGPTGTRENSARRAEGPTGMREDPARTAEGPTGTREDPARRAEGPTGMREDPATTAEDPTGMREDPARRAEDPIGMREDPARRAEGPTGMREDPATTAEGPTGTREDPATTAEGPTGMREDPATTAEGPTGMREDPATTAEGPTGMREDPAESAKHPTGMREDPAGSTKRPTGMREDPAETSKQFEAEHGDSGQRDGDTGDTSQRHVSILERESEPERSDAADAGEHANDERENFIASARRAARAAAEQAASAIAQDQEMREKNQGKLRKNLSSFQKSTPRPVVIIAVMALLTAGVGMLYGKNLFSFQRGAPRPVVIIAVVALLTAGAGMLYGKFSRDGTPSAPAPTAEQNATSPAGGQKHSDASDMLQTGPSTAPTELPAGNDRGGEPHIGAAPSPLPTSTPAGTPWPQPALRPQGDVTTPAAPGADSALRAASGKWSTTEIPAASPQRLAAQSEDAGDASADRSGFEVPPGFSIRHLASTRESAAADRASTNRDVADASAHVQPTSLSPAAPTRTRALTEGTINPAPDLPPATIAPYSVRLAAAKGDPAAEFEIADHFARGRGVPADREAAVRWYKRAAAKGLAKAQFRLAAHYERGRGIAKDIGRAQVWYRRAAEQGHVKAMHNLAVLHTSQDGSPTDYVTAAFWFKQAAERGLRDSQFNLAILRESGLGIERDLVAAYVWYAIAAHHGDKEAARRRNQLKAKLDAKALSTAEDRAQHWHAQPVNAAALPSGASHKARGHAS